MRWSVENWVKRLNSLLFLRISAEYFWEAILGKSLWISLTDENARSRLADRGTRSKIFSTTSSKVLSTLRKIISVFPKFEVYKIRWTILPRNLDLSKLNSVIFKPICFAWKISYISNWVNCSQFLHVCFFQPFSTLPSAECISVKHSFTHKDIILYPIESFLTRSKTFEHLCCLTHTQLHH